MDHGLIADIYDFKFYFYECLLFMLCFILDNGFVYRFMEPLTKGKYPLSIVSLVGKRLPKFTKKQSKILNGSFDFIGINYYTSSFAANITHSNNDTSKPTYLKDTHVNLTSKNTLIKTPNEELMCGTLIFIPRKKKL
jgi:beta-glucosidase/6-phospho-beta-glucosidase/beta-galactosidase